MATETQDRTMAMKPISFPLNMRSTIARAAGVFRSCFAHILAAALLLQAGTAAVACAQGNGDSQEATGDRPDRPWVSAYLASYNHFAPPTGNWGNLPTEQIDWSAFSHLFYFSVQAKEDGTLTEVAPYKNLAPDRIRSIVSAAHSHDTQILYTVGGWGNHAGFASAIRPENRGRFIDNLLQFLRRWKFDGIDLDMEPIREEDVPHYRAFVQELKQKLDEVSTSRGRKPLLTAATGGRPELFASLHGHFNQINVMTYDYSGAWEGWVTWHNSPVYAPHSFPGNGRPLPSIDGSVREFLEAGVPASLLGIGIDFYGYVWQGGTGTPTGGVTRPNQQWDSPPTVTDNVPYHELMKKYYRDSRYHWDDQAAAAWLSIDRPGNSEDLFISFDSEQSIRAKFDYLRKHKLGGVILWELSGGYRETMPAGQRDLLLKIVKEEWNVDS